MQENSGIEGSPIKYYNTPPLVKFYGNTFEETVKNTTKVLFSLKQSLKDEKEFRLAKVFRTEIGEKDQLRKQAIPEDAILSLTSGPNIVNEQMKQLQVICSTKDPSIKICKITEQYGYYHRFSI